MFCVITVEDVEPFHFAWVVLAAVYNWYYVDGDYKTMCRCHFVA